MLSSQYNYTLDEVLEALYILIDEYYFRHNVWLLPESKNNSLQHDQQMKDARNSALIDYVKLLYPYVYKQEFDLSGTDFSYQPLTHYPYCDPPVTLYVAAYQLYAFWINFIGSDFHTNPYMDEKAMPINILAIESYLRFRVDFGENGAFTLADLVSDTDGQRYDSTSDSTIPSLFTIGEIAYMSRLSDSSVRGKLKITSHKIHLPLFFNEGLVIARNINLEGTKTIRSHAYEFPPEFEYFFIGKTGGGAKKLARHKETVIFLSIEGEYRPTRFYYSGKNPPFTIPHYMESSVIYRCIDGWLENYGSSTHLDKLFNYIGADYKDKKGDNIFLKLMAKKEIRLNFCTIMLINNFMLEVQDNLDTENPFEPILRYIKSDSSETPA